MKGLIVCVALLPLSIFGQFSEEYTTYKAKYPEKDMIYLQRDLEVEVEIEDDELKVTSRNIEETLLLTNRAQFFTEDEISYSSFFEVDNVEASSFQFDKKKYRESKVRDFAHKDDLSGMAFHDDQRIISFRYSNLQEGSKTRLSYDEEIKNPRFLPGFVFGGYFPAVKSTYTLIVDKSIELEFYKYNMDGFEVQQSKEEKGGSIIYTWTCTNEPTYDIEPSAVSGRFFLPQIFPVILSYPTSEGKKKLLGSPGDLYNWYQELVSEVNAAEPDPEMIALVEELTADKTTDLEKVKSIYYWAQQNIKYVAYEDGLGGFIPREANDIFEKKFGDCKDNSSIMKEMLKIAGIDSHLTWIGTRDIPYSYSEISTPFVDNHMIITYIDGEDHYFLDATGRFLPIDLPSGFIQGKEAMIGIDAENFEIYEVPEVDGERNAFIDTTEMRIENGDVVGNAHAIIKGYLKQEYFHGLEQNQTEEQKEWFYRENFRKGNNKFELTNLKEINKFEYEKDFEIKYDFSIKNYAIQNENEYYINLNLSKQISERKLEKEDKIDKEFDYKRCGKYHTILEIPEGYSVDYLPPNVTIDNDLWDASIQYEEKNGKVYYSYEINIHFIRLESKYFKEFNNFVNELESAFKESIVLAK